MFWNLSRILAQLNLLFRFIQYANSEWISFEKNTLTTISRNCRLGLVDIGYDICTICNIIYAICYIQYVKYYNIYSIYYILYSIYQFGLTISVIIIIHYRPNIERYMLNSQSIDIDIDIYIFSRLNNKILTHCRHPSSCSWTLS